MRFNAHHAPIGAYATFTLGSAGRGGGFGLEASLPPDQEVYVGVQAPDGAYDALPFFDGGARALEATRLFGVTVDAWEAPGLALRIFSPLRPVPEPGVASADALRDALLPAVLVELELGPGPARRAFFAVHGASRLTESPWGPTPRLSLARALDGGFLLHDGAGRAAGAFCADGTAAAGADVAAVVDGPAGGEGEMAGLRFDVPAGERVTYRIAVAFWHGGEAATGCGYWYTRLFGGLEDVAAYALAHFERLAGEHAAAGAGLDGLPELRRLQLAHAIRSFYGNSALLAEGDAPLWAIVEGEYMFVNTLDLTVDQAFFELRQSPWTVRNELDRFLARHCFEDDWGLSFTHDVGAFPRLAAPGTSAYEKRVHMTAEEVTNWTLTALLYVGQTGDGAWADANAGALERCLRSLLARAPDGIPGVDSTRLGPTGEEITTFDALDDSLRTARGSSYLAGKQWAACLGLAALFADRGRADLAAAARAQAARTEARVCAAAAHAGYVPARLGEPGNPARIIPAVEGLAFALVIGVPLDDHAEYLAVLRAHLETVLQPGLCRFADGGWKLSSTHDNSWLSKVYLAQFVARRILGLDTDEAAEAAHVAWLTDPDLSVWAWSDQIIAGRISSSRYYPRGVTAALWLEEDARTALLRPPP